MLVARRLSLPPAKRCSAFPCGRERAVPRDRRASAIRGGRVQLVQSGKTTDMASSRATLPSLLVAQLGLGRPAPRGRRQPCLGLLAVELYSVCNAFVPAPAQVTDVRIDDACPAGSAWPRRPTAAHGDSGSRGTPSALISSAFDSARDVQPPDRPRARRRPCVHRGREPARMPAHTLAGRGGDRTHKRGQRRMISLPKPHSSLNALSHRSTQGGGPMTQLLSSRESHFRASTGGSPTNSR